jgi:hypothetical protein
VHRAGRCCVRKLPDSVDNTAPDSSADDVPIRCSLGAFHNGLVAIAFELQGGDVPKVDFRYQNARVMKSPPGLPMTLGNAAAARVRLIVWCKACGHQVEPDPAEMAERLRRELSVPDWHQRLVCSACGSRQVDFVVTGAKS